MRVLLIDADSTIPNLALMKLSTYYKSLNGEVDFVQLHIPYYPSKEKKNKYVYTKPYDLAFCSVIFDGNSDYVQGKNIEFGGTGSKDIMKCLPDEIENLDPDYSLYPENNISYGFISRGCIRNCSFCKVPKKEGYIRQVSTIDKIVKHPITKFLDNNILSLPNHKEILQELIDKKIKCQFNQGLDLRLVDAENSKLLSQLNYYGEYIFAFDSWSYLKLLESKLQLLDWRKDWQLKFFVYAHPDMDISDITQRIDWLRANKCLPYLMRDIACWKSENHNFYTDLTSYCNQPAFFKKMELKDFLKKRNPKGIRAEVSYELYKTGVDTITQREWNLALE
jgi:hypothetical protein